MVLKLLTAELRAFCMGDLITPVAFCTKPMLPSFAAELRPMIRQTAAIMKKTVHGVDTLVYRARNALKQELEKEGFDYEEF